MKWKIGVLLLLLGLVGLAQEAYRPKSGYVPDKETAVKIAEAVLIPVYGEKKIVDERPFHADREGDVWTVYGTLYCPDGKGGRTTLPNCFGGVATVQNQTLGFSRWSTGSRLSRTSLDPPAPHYDIPVIEHDRLSRRDRPLRLIKHD